jgi:hypothetical protein
MNRHLRLRRIRQRLFGSNGLRRLPSQSPARRQKQHKHAKPSDPPHPQSVSRGGASTSGVFFRSTFQKSRSRQRNIHSTEVTRQGGTLPDPSLSTRTRKTTMIMRFLI